MATATHSKCKFVQAAEAMEGEWTKDAQWGGSRQMRREGRGIAWVRGKGEERKTRHTAAEQQRRPEQEGGEIKVKKE